MGQLYRSRKIGQNYGIPESSRAAREDNDNKLEWKDGLETKEDLLSALACKLNFDCTTEIRQMEKYACFKPDEAEFRRNFTRSMGTAKKWDLLKSYVYPEEIMKKAEIEQEYPKCIFKPS